MKTNQMTLKEKHRAACIKFGKDAQEKFFNCLQRGYFEIIQKFFDRYDLHNILNLKCNFDIVVLRAGCAQFMRFWAENSTENVKFDFKVGLWNTICLQNDFFYDYFIDPLTVLDLLPSITKLRYIPCEIYSH